MSLKNPPMPTLNAIMKASAQLRFLARATKDKSVATSLVSIANNLHPKPSNPQTAGLDLFESPVAQEQEKEPVVEPVEEEWNFGSPNPDMDAALESVDRALPAQTPLNRAYHTACTNAGITKEAKAIFKLAHFYQIQSTLPESERKPYDPAKYSSTQWAVEMTRAMIEQVQAGATDDDKFAARLWGHTLACAFDGKHSKSNALWRLESYLRNGNLPIRIWTIQLCWEQCEPVQMPQKEQ